MTDLFGGLPVVYQPGFSDFWSVWPRKVAKDKAQVAYNNALKKNPGITPAFLVEAAVRYNEVAQLKPPFAVMHATTFLNGKRWNDDLTFELEAARASAARTAPDGRAKGDSRLDDLRGYWLDTSCGDAPGE